MRFFAPDGKELLPRKAQQYRVSQLMPRMKDALAKSGKQSKILSLIQPETVKPSLLALSQHCFWTGELAIGGIQGVIETEAGWLKGKEVTLVSFDENAVSESEVIKQAKAQSCANDVYRGADLKGYRAARESDQKRQLQGTRFAKIKNLTAYQKTKLNAYARTDPSKAKNYLTPEQLASL